VRYCAFSCEFYKSFRVQKNDFDTQKPLTPPYRDRQTLAGTAVFQALAQGIITYTRRKTSDRLLKAATYPCSIADATTDGLE
jgi:hypothetical protein